MTIDEALGSDRSEKELAFIRHFHFEGLLAMKSRPSAPIPEMPRGERVSYYDCFVDPHCQFFSLTQARLAGFLAFRWHS
jgi:hypothetical protein